MVTAIANLSLGKKSKEALEFYQKIGFELVGQVFWFGSGGMEMPGMDKDDVAFSTLKASSKDNQSAFYLMASPEGQRMGNITLTFEYNDVDTQRMEAIFNGLSEDGQPIMKLGKQVWGDEEYQFAYIIDKFGIQWQLVQYIGEDS